MNPVVQTAPTQQTSQIRMSKINEYKTTDFATSNLNSRRTTNLPVVNSRPAARSFNPGSQRTSSVPDKIKPSRNTGGLTNYSNLAVNRTNNLAPPRTA